MKKILSLSILGLFACFCANAQTPEFVSTEPSNKNVIIEEITGINCGACPNGHRIVRELEEANPGRIFGINIHQGSYAAAYTTQWGSAIANQTGLTGYPTVTVNRHVFIESDTADNGQVTSDTFMAIHPANCAKYVDTIKEQSSFVNVAAQATIDAETRTMTIDVEAYYTADAETGMNLLNVALLQDSIIGPQAGSAYNPAQVTSDGQYIHMNMLRDLITGQWGDTIQVEEGVIPAGTLFQKTYTYQIPASISNEPVKVTHLHLVVFVTKDKQEIYTGSKCIPTVENIPTEINVAAEGLTVENLLGCNDLIKPTLTVSNIGRNITSMQIEYSSDVTPAQVFDWTGNMSFEQIIEIELPEISTTVGSATNVSAKILTVDGETVESTPVTISVNKDAPKEAKGDKLKVIIKTDQYAYETSWAIRDANGNVIAEKSYNAQVVTRDTVEVPISELACYVFEIMDEYGDGGATYSVFDGSNNRIIYGSGGTYTSYKGIDIQVTTLVALQQAEGAIVQTLAYPNPANDKLNLEISMAQSSRANISIVDMLGREVIRLGDVNLSTGNNLIEINTSSLNSGAYFVKIMSNDGITSKKIAINR